jgi:hypothetical protein
MDFCFSLIEIYHLKKRVNKTIRLTTAMTAAKLLSDSDVVEEFCEPVTFCSCIIKDF